MSLGNVLGAAAPIAAGYFLGPAAASFTGGATSGAIAAGALTGAGIAALSGQDILTGGVMGGLSGLGGGGLRGAADVTKLASAGAGGGTTAGVNAITQAPMTNTLASQAGTFNPALTQSTGLPQLTGGTEYFAAKGMAPNMGQVNPITPNVVPNMAQVNPGAELGTGGYNPSTLGRGLDSAKAAFDEPGKFLENLGEGDKVMGAGKLALTSSGPIMAAFEPEVQTFDELRGDKYDPTRRLNLDEIDTGIGAALKRDTGLRLVKEGGHIKGYKGGGGLGLKSLMNSGNTQGTMTNTSTGQVTDMSGQSMLDMLRQAGVVKYEEGGDVGMGAPEFIKQENESYVTLDNDYRLLMSGRLSWEEYSSNPRNVEYFRDEMRREALDREGEEAIKYEDGGAVAPVTSGESYDALIASGVHPMNAMYAAGFTGEELGYTPEGFKPTTGLGEGETPGTDAYAAGLDVPPGTELTAAGKYIYPIIPSYYYGTSDRKITPTATGGIKSLKDMAAGGMRTTTGATMAGGGYLETGGRIGDGMSDDIKARINNQQEARLSDGEFVLPADVVSHLGNGSSDAGAKRLYSMMDRIRQARTGNSKQGKEIKAERYMPA